MSLVPALPYSPVLLIFSVSAAQLKIGRAILVTYISLKCKLTNIRIMQLPNTLHYISNSPKILA